MIMLGNLWEKQHFENFEKMTHFDLWLLKLGSHDKVTIDFFKPLNIIYKML